MKINSWSWRTSLQIITVINLLRVNHATVQYNSRTIHELEMDITRIKKIHVDSRVHNVQYVNI